MADDGRSLPGKGEAEKGEIHGENVVFFTTVRKRKTGVSPLSDDEIRQLRELLRVSGHVLAGCPTARRIVNDLERDGE